MTEDKLKIGKSSLSNSGKKLREEKKVSDDWTSDQSFTSEQERSFERKGNIKLGDTQKQVRFQVQDTKEVGEFDLSDEAKKFGYAPTWGQVIKKWNTNNSSLGYNRVQVTQLDEVKKLVQISDDLKFQYQKKLLNYIKEAAPIILAEFKNQISEEPTIQRHAKFVPTTLDHSLTGWYIESQLQRFVQRNDIWSLAQNSVKQLIVEAFATIVNKLVKIGYAVTLGDQITRDIQEVNELFLAQGSESTMAKAKLAYQFFSIASKQQLWTITVAKLDGRDLSQNVFTGQQIKQFWPNWESHCGIWQKVRKLNIGEVYIISPTSLTKGVASYPLLHHFLQMHTVIFCHPKNLEYSTMSEEEKINFWDQIITVCDNKDFLMEQKEVDRVIFPRNKALCKLKIPRDDKYGLLMEDMKKCMAAQLGLIQICTQGDRIRELEKMYYDGQMIQEGGFLNYITSYYKKIVHVGYGQNLMEQFYKTECFGYLLNFDQMLQLDFNQSTVKGQTKLDLPENQQAQETKGNQLKSTSVSIRTNINDKIVDGNNKPIKQQQNETQQQKAFSVQSVPFVPICSNVDSQVIVQNHESSVQGHDQGNKQNNTYVRDQPPQFGQEQFYYNPNQWQINQLYQQWYRDVYMVRGTNTITPKVDQTQQVVNGKEQVQGQTYVNQCQGKAEKSVQLDTKDQTEKLQVQGQLSFQKIEQKSQQPHVVCLKCQQAGDRSDQMVIKLIDLVQYGLSSKVCTQGDETTQQFCQSLMFKVLEIIKPNQGNE